MIDDVVAMQAMTPLWCSSIGTLWFPEKNWRVHFRHRGWGRQRYLPPRLRGDMATPTTIALDSSFNLLLISRILVDSDGNCQHHVIIWPRGDVNNTHLSMINPLSSWWRHQMESFPALLAIWAGNSPVSGDPTGFFKSLHNLFPDQVPAASGSHFNFKTVFPRYGIPMLNIRRSHDRLILDMGIPILVRRHLYIEMAPWFFKWVSVTWTEYKLLAEYPLWAPGKIPLDLLIHAKDTIFTM